MTTEHSLFKFSATCQTDDRAILYCLRSLCHFAEKHKYPQIGWGGTGDDIWGASKGRLTLRFTNPKYRDQFINEATRLFGKRWTLVSTHDDDPASPQRKR